MSRYVSYRTKEFFNKYPNEVTLLIKTTRRHYVQLQQAIISHHPYEVPEVIATPVTDGHPAYLRWVATETLSDPAADDHA